MGKKGWSQDLEPPGGLVFVVQAVCGVKVELPRGGCSLLFVIQAVGWVEGQAGASIRLVMVVMVVVPWRLADVVVRVAWHRRGRHGAQLVGVVVGVHGRQVGAAVHTAEVGAGMGGVALAVAWRLVVGHGVGSGGSSRAWYWTLHAGRVRRGSWLGERGHSGSRGVSRGDSGAPDGGHGADGARGAAKSCGACMICGRGWRGGRACAGDGRRCELAAALRSGALPGWRGLLLGRPGLGTAATLLLLATLCPPVFEPHLQPKNTNVSTQPLHSLKGKKEEEEKTSRPWWEYIIEKNWGLLSINVHFHPAPWLGSARGLISYLEDGSKITGYWVSLHSRVTQEHWEGRIVCFTHALKKLHLGAKGPGFPFFAVREHGSTASEMCSASWKSPGLFLKFQIKLHILYNEQRSEMSASLHENNICLPAKQKPSPCGKKTTTIYK